MCLLICPVAGGMPCGPAPSLHGPTSGREKCLLVATGWRRPDGQMIRASAAESVKIRIDKPVTGSRSGRAYQDRAAGLARGRLSLRPFGRPALTARRARVGSASRDG
jgi:hypothetical protein